MRGSWLAILPFTLVAATRLTGVCDLAHQPIDPLASSEQIRVLIFARSDCPITKRYAPELQRISREFQRDPVQFWLVFPDASETPQDIRAVVSQYAFPGTPILDSQHSLVRLAQATTAPEAALFDKAGKLLYHGRIDDLYFDIGKSRPVAQIHDLENAISAALAGTPVKQSVTNAVGCSLADVE